MRRIGRESGFITRRLAHRRHAEDGSQLLEFALVLPILLFLVVGAWDFGAKIVLRQKLTNAAREGDRIMVSNPLRNTSSCSAAIPCTVVAASTAVQKYLTSAGLDASWIAPASPSSSTACSWTYTSGGATLSIVSGVPVDRPGTNVIAAIATQVTVSWPVTWQLRSFLPGTQYGPSLVQTTATMPNLVGVCAST